MSFKKQLTDLAFGEEANRIYDEIKHILIKKSKEKLTNAVIIALQTDNDKKNLETNPENFIRIEKCFGCDHKRKMIDHNIATIFVIPNNIREIFQDVITRMKKEDIQIKYEVIYEIFKIKPTNYFKKLFHPKKQIAKGYYLTFSWN